MLKTSSLESRTYRIRCETIRKISKSEIAPNKRKQDT